MRVISARPHGPGGKTIARFDAELDNGVRAFDLKLVRGSDGLRVYGPSLHAGSAITFPAAIADQLAVLALEAVARYGSYYETAA